MSLTAAQHAAVHQETKRQRNAHARSRRLSRKEAERWCEQVGAVVVRWAHHGEWRWTVRAPDFNPVTSDTLERAVRVLQDTIDAWTESRATHGPTGGSLKRYRALPVRELRDGR